MKAFCALALTSCDEHKRTKSLFIKRTLDAFGGTLHPFRNLIWEARLPTASGRAIEELPESERRYFVIAFEGNNAVLTDLQLACDLAPVELDYNADVCRGAEAEQA